MSCRNSHFTGPSDFPFLQLAGHLPCHSHGPITLTPTCVCAHTPLMLPLYRAAYSLASTNSVVGSHITCGSFWLFHPYARNTFPCLSLPLATKYQFTLYISIHKSLPSLVTFPNLLLFLLEQHCA